MEVLKVDFRSPDAPKLFTKSLRETGFAVLINHPISKNLIDDVYDEWTNFFSSNAKYDYQFDPEQQDGYFPLETSETAKGYSIKDIKEFYHFYPWGRLPAGLSNKTKQYYEQASQIAATLLQWVEDYTPSEISRQFSMPLSRMIDDSRHTLLRIIKYPPLTGEEEPGAVRAAAHEDINLLTVLPAATDTGLQVKDIKGRWHDVPCDYGCLVINTADMLQLCSQGFYPSTTHQVTNPEGDAAKRARLSMPLFLHPNEKVRLSNTHTAGEYLLERLREIGLK